LAERIGGSDVAWDRAPELAAFDKSIVQTLGDRAGDRIAKGTGMARNRDDGHALSASQTATF
jgi:hypothetical protein